MDGNGRWAKKRALPRVAGHHEGMKTVRKITRLANDLGVGVLTVYAFSTENWKRPKLEVDFIMRLPEEFLGTYLPELIEQNVRVVMMGENETLPRHTHDAVRKAMEATKDNTGLILNFALNYGSRAEIAQAMQKIAQLVEEGSLSHSDVTEELISQHLMTCDYPNLIYLSAQAEKFVSATLCFGNWPIQSSGLRIRCGQILMKAACSTQWIVTKTEIAVMGD